jgi:adenosine deaminase
MTEDVLADLHRHLDGSLRETTLRDLAARSGVRLPEDPAELRFSPGMGLAQALARFEITLAVLQAPEAVARVASEICEDARADDVDTLEIRFAPQLHRQASPAAIVDAALEGVAGRAGLVLCGLYGEPPGVLEGLVRIAAARPGVVGIDLAGGPRSDHAFRLADYAAAFVEARRLGIGRTVHAAEGRSPDEIRVAVEALGAQRLGHATSLLDDERALAVVIERGVTIEACPTSNVHTGIFADVADHPLPRWLRRGVRACICTDNTLLSGVTATEEHRNAASIPSMTEALSAEAIRFGHEAAFRR